MSSGSEPDSTGPEPLSLPLELEPRPQADVPGSRASIERVLLDEEVRTGMGCWAQVYGGKVISRGAEDVEQQPRIVLKLVDADFFGDASPGWDENFEALPAPTRDEKLSLAREMLSREAKAYSRLEGSTVTPKWYGTYEFLLPDGRLVSGHVLERVSGDSFDGRFYPSADAEDDELSAWILRGAAALQTLHDAGVYHRDICARNVLVPQDCDRTQTPLVLLDFGKALVVDQDHPPTEDEVTRAKKRDFARYSGLFLVGLGVSLSGWQKWLRGAQKTPLVQSIIDALGIRASEEDDCWAAIKRFTAYPHITKNSVTKIIARKHPTLVHLVDKWYEETGQDPTPPPRWPALRDDEDEPTPSPSAVEVAS